MQLVVEYYRVWAEKRQGDYFDLIELSPAKGEEDGDSVRWVRIEYRDVASPGSVRVDEELMEVTAFAPPSARDFHHRLLQTEKPVLFIWYEDNDQPGQLFLWNLGVPSEATGEGTTDPS